MKILPILAAFLLSALTCRGAEFDLGAPGMLSLDLPAGWTASGMPMSGAPGQPGGHFLVLKPDSASNAKARLTFVFTAEGSASQADLRASVEKMCQPILKRSVEKTLDVRDFALERGFGAYCVLTDAALVGKAPKPNDYKILANGQVRLNADLLGFITLFTDDTDGPELRTMIKIVESIQIKPRSI